MACKICGKDRGANNTRMGVCFDCAEAESIILNGTDMYENKVAETAMEKLVLVAKLLGIRHE